jgi:hypothetical protein
MNQTDAIKMLQQIVDVSIQRGVFSNSKEVIAAQTALDVVVMELSDMAALRLNLLNVKDELDGLRDPK